MTARYIFNDLPGTAPGALTVDSDGNVTVAIINNINISFNAIFLSDLIDGHITVIPVGSSATTYSGAYGVQGALMTSSGTITSFYAQHGSRPSNGAGQTVRYLLYFNNSLIATISGLSAGPTVTQYSGHVSLSQQYSPGDVFSVKTHPDGTLTDSVADITTAIS